MDNQQEQQEVRLTVRIPADLAGRMRALAQEHSRSFNGEIVWALRTYVQPESKTKERE
jgi:predicted transcriptional regulator